MRRSNERVKRYLDELEEILKLRNKKCTDEEIKELIDSESKKYEAMQGCEGSK